MERLQGPINHSCFFGEHFDHHQVADQSLEEHGLARFEEELEDKMPFLQMLQSVHETPSFWPLNKEPSFRTLLKLQHLKRSPWELGVTTNYYNNNTYHYMNNNMYHEIMEAQIQALDFESCVTTPPPPTTTTHDIVVDYNDHQLLPQQDQRQQLQCPEEDLAPIMKETQKGKPSEATKERRRRKRARPAKNKEEVESQRMTHIAVERNRRRQMNDHLNVLTSLMPSSYIQRGDQASIVGGAIDFVKELEQLLQSLEAQKRMRITTTHEISNNSLTSSSSSSSSSSVTSTSSNGLLTSSLARFRAGRDDEEKNKKKSKTSVVIGEEVRAENKSECADIEARVIQTHVNLKVQCPKRPGQLLKAIVALEDLRLTVLHLSITSSHDTILYSFNLKIEDGCQLGSADEIAGAVHRIFRIIDQS